MKISIGAETINGPFGGGNEFLKNLKEYLNNEGHTVINHLNDRDIDVIFCFDPRPNSKGIWY